MFEEIKDTVSDTFDNIRDTIGDKGFYIFIGVAVIFGLYWLSKGSSETSATTDELTTVTSISSYPDAVTNANVIIDTLQNSIAYSEGIIVEEIQGLGDELKTEMQENFTATNDYITEGFESQKKLLEENFDNVQGSISNYEDSYDNILEATKQGVSAVTSVSGTLSNILKDLNNTKVVNSSTPKTTTTTTPSKSSSDTYTYKTKSGLNTATSIVDALKATGVDSSMANREKIAEANGIKNYTGTAQQNVELLNKLKSGDLKKVQ